MDCSAHGVSKPNQSSLVSRVSKLWQAPIIVTIFEVGVKAGRDLASGSIAVAEFARKVTMGRLAGKVPV